MFTNISWSNYIVVLFCYWQAGIYLLDSDYILMTLKKLKRKLQFRGFDNPNYQDPQSEINHQDSPEAILHQTLFGEFDSTFQDVDALVERLKSFIADASKGKLLKQEFLDYIQLILNEYPCVKDSAFRFSVSDPARYQKIKYG